MGYDPTAFYGMGYDPRGMPVSMHGGPYEPSMDMYLNSATAPMSSRPRNPTEVNSE